MADHCVHLNLNINPVNIDHSDLKKKYQTCINLTQLNSDFVDLLKNHGIKISYAESFYSQPYRIQTIHTDCMGGDYVKINFIYGGQGSEMHWYKIKETSIPVAAEKTSVNTDYIPWKEDMVDLIESNTLAYPSLVQAGCPHSVTNKNEDRLCITVVLCDLISSKRLTMAEAQFKLQEFLI